MNIEPSLDQIDDYNNNESPQKRRTVRLVIIGILVVGAVFSFIKYKSDNVNDYIGTPEKPGINTAR